MWMPKEAGGLGAALRPPMGPGRSPGGGPGGRSPRELANSRHFGCNLNFPTLQENHHTIIRPFPALPPTYIDKFS